MGEADCRETAPGTPSLGTWPLGPQPQKGPCPPRGRALFPRPACPAPPPPRPPALCPQEGGLQDFQPSLGCLLSFSKPSSRRRRESCQDKSPSPLPLPAPSPSPEFPTPAAFPNSFPFPTLAPAPPAPPLLVPKFQVQVGGGQVDSTVLGRRW